MCAETQKPKCPRPFTWNQTMLKKLALGAFVLILGATLTLPARAADVGGTNGLADLEERVAELEVAAARSGNRKVTITITGQINKAVVFHDADVPSFIAKRTFGDGSQSPTAIGINGKAKLAPNWTAGFRFELGVDENAIPILQDQIVVRHSAIWVENAQMGRFTLGHTSTATDGIAEITTANVAVASKMLSLEPIASHYLFGLLELPFDGTRRNVVRYDSPSMGGFVASASYSQGDRIGPILLSDGDVWDSSLRYAGEFGGFRAAAGVGYRMEDHNAAGPFLGATAKNALSGSVSIMHMASGIFANAAAGKVMELGGPGGPDLTGMHGQAGIEKNIFGVGATTFYGGYAKLDASGGGGSPTLFEGGAVQALDAAAMDLYLSWKQVDLDNGSDPFNVWMLGARIRF